MISNAAPMGNSLVISLSKASSALNVTMEIVSQRSPTLKVSSTGAALLLRNRKNLDAVETNDDFDFLDPVDFLL
eukprot:CAMPEP_0169282800 /NCGR_PEP_ID=MMETSP1016-20121227/57145_1 /TAXON_ID=342587 /ORGANISM="Karlodinium micrum, Strain CCMP2283" /LENGTH=73 /DNA_ID=CAMNT_0009371839 /DNA_START=489 /DNA_END=706 /DNA_ORIENTATION=+